MKTTLATIVAVSIAVLAAGGCNDEPNENTSSDSALEQRVATLEAEVAALKADNKATEKRNARLAEPRDLAAQRKARAEADLKRRREAGSWPNAADGSEAASPFEQYQRLYSVVGSQLDKAGLPAGHRLVREYLEINYQSGIMNDSVRKQSMARLRTIAAKLKKRSMLE